MEGVRRSEMDTSPEAHQLPTLRVQTMLSSNITFAEIPSNSVWTKTHSSNFNSSMFHAQSLDIRSTITVAYLVTFVLGVAGNGLVLFIIGYYRQVRQKSVANYYIWNLSLADLCYVLTLPLFCFSTLAREWPFGKFTCKLAFAVRETNKYASVLTLVALSADRYMASFSTFGHLRTMNVGKVLIAIIWTICGLFSTPYWIYATTVTHADAPLQHHCRFMWPQQGRLNYIKWWLFVQLGVGLVFPAVIIVACYIGLACRLNRLIKASCAARGRQRPSRRMSKTVLIVVLTFILCQTPYYVMEFVKLHESMRIATARATMEPYIPSFNKYRLQVIFSALSQTLVFLSSCCNPFIYGLFNENYRQLYTAALCRSRNRTTSTSSRMNREGPSTSLPLVTYGLRIYPNHRKSTEVTACMTQTEYSPSTMTQIPAPIEEENELEN